MKDSSHGTHQPGIRRAGEGDHPAPSQNDFDALARRVKALENATPGGGGKLFRLVFMDGQDATSGPAGRGLSGFQGWTIVSGLRWQKTDGFNTATYNGDGEWGPISNTFINPVPDNGSIQFVEGNDYSAWNYVLLLQSP